MLATFYPQGHSAAGRIRSIENSNALIGNRTHNLPAYSIVPQPTALLCAQKFLKKQWFLLQGNAKLHITYMTMRVLADIGGTHVKHPSYSSDLIPM
jgi:hypothetical protein